MTRLLTRHGRTRTVELGATVFAAWFIAYAVLGVVAAGTTLTIGVIVATAASAVGELMNDATASAMRLLRYYEEQHLLQPQRRPSGYREYSEADVGTVRRIRSLLAAGLSTTTIATVLPCVREEGERLVPTCSVMLAGLTQERRRIIQAINDLQTSRDALDTVIAAAPADIRRAAESTD
ncbi:MerR family transcriptional regulator [Micromonospora sp. CPCC 205543]